MKLKHYLTPLVVLIATFATASHETYSHPEYGFSAVFPARTSVVKDASDEHMVTFTYDDEPTWKELQVTVYPNLDYVKVPDVKTWLEKFMNGMNASDVKMEAGGITWSKDDSGHLRATATFMMTGSYKDGRAFRIHATQRFIAVPETGYLYQLSFLIHPEDETTPSDTNSSDFLNNFKLLK